MVTLSAQPSLLLEDEETPIKTNVVSNVSPEVFSRLKLPIRATVTYQNNQTNKVEVQIFVIRDISGSREFYFNLTNAIEAVKIHNNNYRRGFILEGGPVVLLGGKPLVFDNKEVKEFILLDTRKQTRESHNSFDKAVNMFNMHNANYHGRDNTAPVILEKIVYTKGEQISDL